MTNKEWIFTAKNITKTYGAHWALDNVDFGVYNAEVVGLLGDNGAGKSTLVKVLSGILKPDSGDFEVDGNFHSISSRSDSEKAGIETIYQDSALCDNLSITRNIFMGREIKDKWGFLEHNNMNRIATEVLNDVIHISGVDNPDKEVGKLSGGQKQAVAIARAIYFKSRILILDEPTSALSVREVERLLGYVEKLRDDGVSCVLVTHNLYHAWLVCDRFTVMSQGKKIADVTKEDTTLKEITDFVTRH